MVWDAREQADLESFGVTANRIPSLLKTGIKVGDCNMFTKRVLLSLMVIFLMAALIGGGTYALFSDVEQSADNTFCAGTLDLKTNDADGVNATITATCMKPGDRAPESGNATIQLKNVGNIDGSTLDINFTYVECDGENPSEYPANMTADETAAVLEVLVLNYGGSSLLGSVNDTNSNGYKDIQDLAGSDLTGQSGINAGQTRDFDIAVQLRSSVGNDYQADGINMTITFTLNQ